MVHLLLITTNEKITSLVACLIRRAMVSHECVTDNNINIILLASVTIVYESKLMTNKKSMINDATNLYFVVRY